MIQEVLHKLEHVIGKLTLHTATCLFNQQKIHHIIMYHIKNGLTEWINVIIHHMIQEVLHKLDNFIGKLKLHTATCLFNQQKIHHNNVPH